MKQKKKKEKEAFVFPPEDDFACCSGTDCTGLIPAGLTSEEEAEAYQELYPYMTPPAVSQKPRSKLRGL